MVNPLPSGCKVVGARGAPAWVSVPGSVNVARSVFGADAFVGPWAEVIGAVVGARTRIQSHSVVCPGVVIGHDCFVGHGVVFTNDRFGARGGHPAANFDPATWAATVIGNHVCIGSGAVVLPVTVCDDVVIGAGAVVTRDIGEPGVYAGNPARRLGGLARLRPHASA
jgi:acetyltransferase-like isoleucine patch superfamily enzyme